MFYLFSCGSASRAGASFCEHAGLVSKSLMYEIMKRTTSPPIPPHTPLE